MSDLETLRAQYKEVVGKNAYNGWDAAELQKRIEEHKAGDRNGNEPANEPEKPARELRGKAKEVVATSTDPYPSQADLDAMKDGTYRDRELKSR